MDHTQYTTNKADRKPGKHLTREDRGAIEAMKKLGQSNRAIARYLNCSPTTVSNELKRGTRPKNGRSGRTPDYCAKCGMLVYQTHRANCHKPHSLRKGSTFAQWVVNQVRQEKWSLDACVGYARKHKLFLPTEMVFTKTLYNEVWAGNLVLEPLELPEALKRKKCCKSTGNRKKAYGTSTDERPQIASSRLEVGHWEGDTVVGKRNGKEAIILTLLEKKTQHYLAIRIPGKTSEAVNAAMQKLREDFGESFFSQIFKTITVDNGPEFADFAQTEQFGTKVYFAHPYTNSQLNSSIIHCLPVILEMTWLDNLQMVSHKRSTTFSRVAKISLRNPRLRISFQICSMGFISGVYGGMWKRTIFSGNSRPADLCHAAPSQQSNMISSE